MNRNVYGPEIVEAHGYVVPKDSMAEPTIIPVDESKLKIIPVGKPKVVPTNINIHQAGTPKVVLAGIPRVCTPGQDTFSLPITLTGIDSPFIAGIPEVVIAKDAGVKDHNPQNFSSFGKNQGLKSGNISCMLQDEKGNLWIGTSGGGVTKYDGKYFTYLTEKEGLCNNFILSILKDKNGNFWFGTNGGGVSKYDGKYFTTYSEREGLSNNVVTSIIQDKNGSLWFGTYGGGVSKYDGTSFTHYTYKNGLSDDFIWSVLEDKNGNLWFGTDGNGASRFDGRSFTHFTEKEGLGQNLVGCMLQDKVGNIWFGTNGGVSKYDGKSFTTFGIKEGLSDSNIASMLEDKNGDLWIGTYGSGISKYDGKSFTNFTEENGLPNNNILCILQDRSGNLWFGTQGGGVSKYVGALFTSFTEKEGLSNNEVRNILQDKDGNLWFCTFGGGISKFNGKSFTQYTHHEGLSINDDDIMCMTQDHNGNFWFGFSGISKFDGSSFTQFTGRGELIYYTVLSMLQTKNGDLWFGTQGGGVSKYDGKNFTTYSESEGLSNKVVYSILQDKNGNLWFGTQGGGVSKFDGKSFTIYRKKEGMSNNVVLSMMEDRTGNLWFGTWGGGVSKYDGKFFTHFTEKEGLINNFVYCMLQDKKGNLWFGTRLGLSKLPNEKLITIYDKIKLNRLHEKDIIFKNYTNDDGFQGIGCNGNAIYEAKDGTIWIGANDKLIAFHPEGDVEDSISPNIQITGIELFNENIPWSSLRHHNDSILILGNGVKVRHFLFNDLSLWYGLPEDLSLNYKNNNLTFNFIGITMNQPKNVKYQYKLEGNDDNWSAITTSSEAPYGNLSSGDYIFKVKAMNSEGYWSNEFQYPFTIRPPWWATWWAYSLYVFLTGSIIYSLYRNRINQLENKQAAQIKTMVATQEDERKRISRDLHDDVGTKLTALKLTLSALGEKASGAQNEEIKSLATSSEQIIKEAMQDVRQLLLNLSPSVLEEFGYTTAIEGLVNKINGTKQIHFNLVVFGMKERLKKEYELALYRITQELINNVIKHARAKHVSLQIGQRDEKIILMIEDDGMGFDVSTHKDGYGLNNLDARTKLMHGTMAIDSHPGKGTSILIEIPYHSS